MRLKLELEADATEALARSAVAERRPVVWQAEILLRRALGLSDAQPAVDGKERGNADAD